MAWLGRTQQPDHSPGLLGPLLPELFQHLVEEAGVCGGQGAGLGPHCPARCATVPCPWPVL